MNVGIGPTNAGGQAYMLAAALRESGVVATSFAFVDQHPAPLQFPVDVPMDRGAWGTPSWRRFVQSFSHLLAWNGLSPFGPRRWWTDEPIEMAVVFRGSELRDPRRHRKMEAWSPFGDDELTQRLQSRRYALQVRLDHRPPAFSFVATLEMLDYLPSARWLPIIARPAETQPLFAGRPVALHLPTNGQLKGSSSVDELRLSEVEIRRPGLMWPEEALAAIGRADILIGGLVLGDYGGTEIQAMAAGRVVVANVSKRVRRRLDVPIPIVQATPDTLADVLRDIAARTEHYHEIAALGPAFVARFHDGRYSVSQLGAYLSQAVAA